MRKATLFKVYHRSHLGEGDGAPTFVTILSASERTNKNGTWWKTTNLYGVYLGVVDPSNTSRIVWSWARPFRNIPLIHHNFT